VRNATLVSVLAKAGPGLGQNEHMECDDGEIVFRHACKMGLEGIVSKRKDSPYRSGRSSDWLKMKNPACAAVKREAEEETGRGPTSAPRSSLTRLTQLYGPAVRSKKILTS
jgi:ATP-dependent DNA ligase